MALGFSAVVLRHFSPSFFHASRQSEPDRQSEEASRNLLVATQQEALRDAESRPVYPYSVVAGGVRDARELKWAAEHDPVVAAHYAGFDYDHARVVRLVLARTAFISYRIGNKVYWTRHRVSLKKGETVLTDGKIIARTRCANRVETVPQQANAEIEPPYVKFDQPGLPSTAISNPPVPYESSLLTPPASGPAPPLTLYDPIGGGSFVPLAPPPLPGVCGVGKGKSGSGGSGGKGKGNPCPTEGGGGVVPEPATLLLMGSGLAAVIVKARQKFTRH
ncbi:MAG: PEP-CTERM sorting domain-containing protein [Candidatus Sulfotelmatobacter sp.]